MPSDSFTWSDDEGFLDCNPVDSPKPFPFAVTFPPFRPMALLSCSSSYAASRLFIVDLRLERWEAALARDALELLLFGERERVPSLAIEVARDAALDER